MTSSPRWSRPPARAAGDDWTPPVTRGAGLSDRWSPTVSPGTPALHVPAEALQTADGCWAGSASAERGRGTGGADMARLTTSHDSGSAATQLVGDTIGAALAVTVGAPARRTGAGLASPRVAVDVGGAGRGGRAGRARAARARHREVRPCGHLVAELRRVDACCSSRARGSGAILVIVNPAYRPNELAYALRQSGVRLLVTAEAFKTSDYLDDARPGARRPARARAGGHDRHRASRRRRRHGVGRRSPDSASSADSTCCATREASLDCDDPINIQYTSGTTGNPKGATLTHHNILNNGRLIAETLGYTAADRVCIPVPLYHCFGMGVGNLGCVTSGSTMVYPAPQLRAAGDAGGDRRGAVHEHLRGADDVHRASRAPAVRRLRPHVASHRDHGRRAVPDRGDEARDQRDALHRDLPSPTA